MVERAVGGVEQIRGRGVGDGGHGPDAGRDPQFVFTDGDRGGQRRG
ncbi:hypothetical protein ACWEO2_31820 [Nocardia sp. NPDC004278]